MYGYIFLLYVRTVLFYGYCPPSFSMGCAYPLFLSAAVPRACFSRFAPCFYLTPLLHACILGLFPCSSAHCAPLVPAHAVNRVFSAGISARAAPFFRFSAGIPAPYSASACFLGKNTKVFVFNKRHTKIITYVCIDGGTSCALALCLTLCWRHCCWQGKGDDMKKFLACAKMLHNIQIMRYNKIWLV